MIRIRSPTIHTRCFGSPSISLPLSPRWNRLPDSGRMMSHVTSNVCKYKLGAWAFTCATKQELIWSCCEWVRGIWHRLVNTRAPLFARRSRWIYRVCALAADSARPSVCVALFLCLKLTSCTAGRVDLVFSLMENLQSSGCVWMDLVGFDVRKLSKQQMLSGRLLNAKFVNEIYVYSFCTIGAHWKW